MKLLQWETRRVRLNTDQELSYQAVGRGLPVLLVNGLGGSRVVWEALIEHAQAHYRFITWDFRGLHSNGTASAPPLAEHAHDALAILDAEGISRCALVAWSMGVAVGLELFSQAPSRLASLVLLCGAPRAAWAAASPHSLPAIAVARTLRLARRYPRASGLLIRGALRSPETFTWARRIGLVGEQVGPDDFAKLISELLELDLTKYAGFWDRLAEYDAEPILSQVDIPALVIGGGRDPFTARAGLEELAQGIVGAEYLFLPDGTHYLLLDQAERVNLRIEKFWNERGYAAP
jgi:3-oxoadipate enol-lactonase